MAQDFGDDMGNALLNFVTRQTENYLRFGRGRERAFDWWQRHYKKEGNTPEAAKAMAEKQSSREQVVVPFGTSEEAAYYAQVCRENGTYAAAYTDKQGNGFLAFAKEDAKTVAGYAPQFKDVMARLDEQRITDALNHAEPVNKKTMDSLTELTSYPDLPAEDVTVIPVTIRYKDAPDKTYDVLFSEQDTENLNIDDSICFSGYSHKELTEMVGRETREDFDVISVGAPYKVHATQVKTDAPEKTYDVPGKDAPARSDRVATLRAEDTAIHTQNIRNAAQKAREDCTDFSDFERKMNAQGFGVTETSKVLTAVMTAVLIFQSACPTGLAYAAQKSGVSAYAAGQTIDQALGATKTVESVLSQHENDEYYLTTPYGNKGPHGEDGAIDTWDCWKPKGEYGSGAYMNCAGFVVAVLRACGADTSIIGNYTAKDGYNRGNESNASKWEEYCRDNNAVSYTFSSKEQMLASGILEKGDIIHMEPVDWNHSNSDCHIGFFWGSNSSEDLFWHSSSHADGIVKGYFPNSAGGNVISKITPKYPARYYRVIKTLHKGYLTLHKDSSNKTLTDANDCYSLAGAEYGVYTDSNCSNKVATLTTNASGNANTVSLNPGRYYVKETKARGHVQGQHRERFR